MKNAIPMSQNLVKMMARTVIPTSMRHWIHDQLRKRQARREKSLFLRSLRPTDVFLVGHPKSGNTWLTLMLGILIERKHGKRITLSNLQEFIPTIHASDEALASYSQMPDPRCFRNEGPVYPELYPKTIYIVRDPRATYVSYYHHCVHDTGNADWKIQDFVDEMLTHGCIRNLEPYLVRWDRQVEAWIDRSEKQPVKIVKYEDMKHDRRKVLEELIEFLGITCDEETMHAAVQRGSFESMRREEEIHGAESYPGEKGKKGFFVRKGSIDGWKEELSQELIVRIEDEFSEAMKKVGYL